MSSALAKALSVMEFLAYQPIGSAVSDIAKSLDMPISGVHRLLKELEGLGYVRQVRGMGDYELTIKLASLGLAFLGQTGIGNISQPILDELAQQTRELVRLSLADNGDLVWVGVSQGSTSALRYQPGQDQGKVVHLASSAGGQAWLAGMSDEEAISLVMRQGLVKDNAPGVSAPVTVADLLSVLKTVRERGYAVNHDSYLDGMAAIAMVVRNPDSGEPIGAVSVAGPSVRVTPEVMETYVEPLQRAAIALGDASRASLYFSKRE
ncbi:IclR family transcriptional regulator [Marinomonas sp. BSi20584]|uniref:IclR family transcriptional regulator n=1 Tax=Marinomonas sp. BSi20584 TaxID=1594462 RepID=UPI000C1E367B|nr:IclR family transcriptional regulator [Marinomonas sp. BSi20584]PJE56175.1 hypothetical protein TY87_06515 [Marinomonas sp. BSi20584]